jgi:hypothetical protein
MRSLHDKSFFWAWDIIYSASNPGRDKDRWVIDGVLWIKERHAYWGNGYSLQLEVHQLQTQHNNKPDWKLLVTVERWWGPDKTLCIRDQFWSKVLDGKSDVVRAWVDRNAAQLNTAMR